MTPEAVATDAAPTATANVRVSRDGAITCRTCRKGLGWVDTWAPTVRLGRGRRWRYVLPGGFSHGDYTQRQHAVADLLAFAAHTCRGVS